MIEYYYQIKGKHSPNTEVQGWYGGAQTWVFPPIFSGKVVAKDKKIAKLLIEEEYGRKFPLKVLSKDLDSNEFLLSIKEIKETDYHTKRLFEPQKCIVCENPYTIIEKYNDINCTNKSPVYCSDRCKDDDVYNMKQAMIDNENLSGKTVPVIYKITNKNTGKSYIGKTTQVFTLRWYQHFFQTGDNEFHREIKNSKYSDWIFEIIELVKVPEEIKRISEFENYIVERERYYINQYNTINEGYNSKL